ncbi:MAG: hypothetical protein NT062_33830 [Proteobacteria bacterium]|nr:hypothetical protein [Pseudomonadota bacterium]
MSRVHSRPIAFAALGPIAIGGILAVRADQLAPLFAVPAIVFGVVAATAPALYIATAATGAAPPVATVVRALVTALGAFGIALVGLVLPAAFLSLSSLSITTTVVVTSAALAGAGLLALRRLAGELGARSLGAAVVFGVWSLTTLGIAGRLWADFAWEVIS